MSTALATSNWLSGPAIDYAPASSIGLGLAELIERNRNFLRDTAHDWASSAYSSLVRIHRECDRPGWDGEGAAAISPRTLGLTMQVLTAIYDAVANGTPPPDVFPEPDGEVDVSWYLEGSRVLSLSIGEHGVVNFAAKFDDGAIHGWRRLDTTNSATLTSSLHDIIRSLNNVLSLTAESRAT